MKKLVAVLIVMVFALMIVAPMALAQEQQQQEARYTGRKILSGTAKTGCEATKGVVETGASPLVAFWKSITGQDTPEKIVTKPVERGGQTIYDASVGTGKTVTGTNVVEPTSADR